MNLKPFLFATLLCLTTVWVNAAEIQASHVSLSPKDKAMMAWVDARSDDILAELKTHVEMNTGTENISGLNAYRALLKRDLEALGFATQERSSAPVQILTCRGGEMQFADHLIGTLRGKAKNRVFINGHMDTVFSATDEFQTLTQSADGTLAGPGVADMKGGIVIVLNALRALRAQGLLNDAHLTVLFNSDEEIGSLGSRAIIEELAVEHDVGLVFEGGSRDTVTRARKGLGQARIRVTGRESHAGGAHENGVSASLEMAHKVIEIEKLTDYSSKSTVNVGVLSGGEKRNTVPGCADAYVDMRFTSVDRGEALKAGIKEIANKRFIKSEKFPDLPKSESWAILHRPVKPEHPVVDALIADAMGYSKLIGEPIVGTSYSGGGTDGSIAQGVGLPTMDSLGMNGAGAHSSREVASVQSLIARTKLAAVMLARQLQAD